MARSILRSTPSATPPSSAATVCCYLVEWKGYEETGEGLEWVSTEDIQVPDALMDFHALNPDKPGPIVKLVASDYCGGCLPGT